MKGTWKDFKLRYHIQPFLASCERACLEHAYPPSRLRRDVTSLRLFTAGVGDCDLLLRFGGYPTLVRLRVDPWFVCDCVPDACACRGQDNYDFASRKKGANEELVLDTPALGTW